jgi:hypothetical protein
LWITTVDKNIVFMYNISVFRGGIVRKATMFLAAFLTLAIMLQAQISTTATLAITLAAEQQTCGKYWVWPFSTVYPSQQPSSPPSNFNGCYELWISLFFSVGYPNGLNTLFTFTNPTVQNLTAVYVFHGLDGQNMPVLDFDPNQGMWTLAPTTTTEVPTKPGETNIDQVVAKAADLSSTTPVAGIFSGSADVLVQVNGSVGNTDTSALDQVVAAQSSNNMEKAPLRMSIIDTNGKQLLMSNPVLYRSILPGKERVVSVSLPNPPIPYRVGWSERIDGATRKVVYSGPLYAIKNLEVTNLSPDAINVWLADSQGGFVCNASTVVINPGETSVGSLIGKMFPESCFKHQGGDSTGSRLQEWNGFVHFVPVDTINGLFLPEVVKLNGVLTNEQ